MFRYTDNSRGQSKSDVVDMRTYLRKCVKCNAYTLKDICPSCKQKTGVPIPARFSPQDRYGKYRRELKLRIEKEG